MIATGAWGREVGLVLHALRQEHTDRTQRDVMSVISGFAEANCEAES